MPWYDKPLKKIGLNSVPQRFNQVTDEWEIETTEADPVYDTEVLNKLNELDAKINGIIEGTTPANTKLTGSSTEIVEENLAVPAGSNWQISIENVEALKGNLWVRCDQTHDVVVYLDTDSIMGVGSESIASNAPSNWVGGAIRYNVDDKMPASRFTTRVVNNGVSTAKVRIGNIFQR